MRILPTYQLSVLGEEGFREKMSAITAQMEPCRKEGTFTGFDGRELYYESFCAQGSRGAVVILHGLSEFTKKYHEFAWYLLNQGYDVFLYDHRCHGRSCRLTSRQEMIHVDNFSDYRKDLEQFIRQVVRPATDLPLYLYGHSMGGAVAAQYLAHHPDVFQKAVLSAPMVLPLTGGVPPFIARSSLWMCWLFGMGKLKFWSASEFDPEYPFERSKDQSRARFDRNMVFRLENPCYRTTPITIRWTHQSITQCRKLTSNKYLSRIKTPVLMICAEHDGVVQEEAQAQCAENCPACTRVVLEGSTHSMLCGTKDIVEKHVKLVLDHFA